MSAPGKWGDPDYIAAPAGRLAGRASKARETETIGTHRRVQATTSHLPVGPSPAAARHRHPPCWRQVSSLAPETIRPEETAKTKQTL